MIAESNLDIEQGFEGDAKEECENDASVFSQFQMCRSQLFSFLLDSPLIKYLLCFCVIAIFLAYVIFGSVIHPENIISLLVMFHVVLFVIALKVFERFGIAVFVEKLKSLACFKIMEVVLCFAIFVGCILLCIYKQRKQPENLIPFAGLFILVVLTIITSKHPERIKWRPVITGFLLQFLIGYAVMQTEIGFWVVRWIGCRYLILVDASKTGIDFVLGGLAGNSPLIDGLLTVVMFYALINVLYHFNIIPFFARKLAILLHFVMGTTIGESMNAAVNIFVGLQEAFIIVEPFIHVSTKSELFAIMVGGMCTISGPLMTVYINMGVSPVHLVTASAMSAPAALAFAKISVPPKESRITDLRKDESSKLSNSLFLKSPFANAVDAASQGCIMGLKVVAGIIANLIMILSLVQLFDYTLSWLGSFVDFEHLTFQSIVGFLLSPLAFLIGADYSDLNRVGFLMGAKTITNEFYAYQELSKDIQNNTISMRSQVISTYALCGFSNVGTIGLVIGALTTMVPSRREHFSRFGLRAMIVASIACFSTACVAGLLYSDETINPSSKC